MEPESEVEKYKRLYLECQKELEIARQKEADSKHRDLFVPVMVHTNTFDHGFKCVEVLGLYTSESLANKAVITYFEMRHGKATPEILSMNRAITSVVKFCRDEYETEIIERQIDPETPCTDTRIYVN